MLTLEQLSKCLNGVWHGNAKHAVFSYSSLSRATSGDLAYYDNSIPLHVLSTTAAGVVLLKAEHHHLYAGNCIIVIDPLAAMHRAMAFLSVPEQQYFGIHPTAQIHPSVQLGQRVSVGAYSVLGDGVQLADNVRIGAHTVIESSVSIGSNTIIGHSVVLHSGCRLGANNVINASCIIGASPFNFLKAHGQWQQGAAVGGVILADGVQLGANTVIDRGSLSDTCLGEGVCVDNLVHIAHDVVIGANTVIAGCAVLGAYARIGADCIIGGASTIAAHLTVADDVVITGMSTVNKSINKPGIYSSGTLVHEHQRWRRNAARFKRLDDYITKLTALEKRITEIE